MSIEHPEQCFELLHSLAEASGYDTQPVVDIWVAGDALGFSAESTQRHVRDLLDERLLHPTPSAGGVCLSPMGVAAVNLALADPDKPTVYFPALSGFFGLGDDRDTPLCKHSLSVLLDQLAQCRGLLGAQANPAPHLEQRLLELERLVGESRVETTSLRRGLQRLRESLSD